MQTHHGACVISHDIENLFVKRMRLASHYVLYISVLLFDARKCCFFFFFFSSRRRHTRFDCDWSSDVCSSDLAWQRRLKLVLSPLYIPLAMFFLLGLAQYWARLPLDRFETRQALVLLGADLTFFFLATQLFASADSRTWRLFGPTVLLFAGSLGLFAILQTASGTAQIYGVVETPGNLHFGPYVNPNHYAGLMEMRSEERRVGEEC